MGTNFYLMSKSKKLMRAHFAVEEKYGISDEEYEIVDEPYLGYRVHLNKLRYHVQSRRQRYIFHFVIECMQKQTVAKEQIRQIISENNSSSVADVYALLLWAGFPVEQRDLRIMGHNVAGFVQTRIGCIPV